MKLVALLTEDEIDDHIRSLRHQEDIVVAKIFRLEKQAGGEPYNTIRVGKGVLFHFGGEPELMSADEAEGKYYVSIYDSGLAFKITPETKPIVDKIVALGKRGDIIAKEIRELKWRVPKGQINWD